jgi:hypothetical protein
MAAAVAGVTAAVTIGIETLPAAKRPVATTDFETQ